MQDKYRPTCLMHSDDAAKNAEAFAREIERMLDEGNGDFRRFVFVQPQKFSALPPGAMFEEARFLSKVVLDGSIIEADFKQCRFLGEVVLRNVTVTGPFDFHGASVADTLTLDRCTFRDAFRLQYAKVRRIEMSSVVCEAPATFTALVVDGRTMIRNCRFSDLSFARAHFHRETYFEDVTFAGRADFSGATFTAEGRFRGSRFCGEAIFDGTIFRASSDGSGIADFVNVTFDVPQRVLFRQINRNASGLRLRLLRTNVEGVRFEDVHWLRKRGRLLLQDELDLAAVWYYLEDRHRWAPDEVRASRLTAHASPAREDAHRLVAHAYQRLIKCFDAQLDHELAEEAFYRAMEMRRLDRRTLPFGSRLASVYEKVPTLTRVIQHANLFGLYEVVSRYGTSYFRALIVLLLIVLAFAGGYVATGDAPFAIRGGEAHLARAVLLSLEVASFQRDLIVPIRSPAGRSLRIAETILVPSQGAILLLALRRRFKR